MESGKVLTGLHASKKSLDATSDIGHFQRCHNIILSWDFFHLSPVIWREGRVVMHFKGQEEPCQGGYNGHGGTGPHRAAILTTHVAGKKEHGQALKDTRKDACVNGSIPMT
jgi:hypothetical protein